MQLERGTFPVPQACASHAVNASWSVCVTGTYVGWKNPACYTPMENGHSFPTHTWICASTCTVIFVWVLNATPLWGLLFLLSVSLFSYSLWCYELKPQHCWCLMLFPHLLLFPISACNMTLPAVRKLCKTQGKLPQWDTTLLFPMLPLPRHLLFPQFPACHKSKCVPRHWLHVVGA